MPICGRREGLPPVGSLRLFLEASFLREPNSTALVDVPSGERLTFRQLSARVNKLTRFLRKLLNRCNQNSNVDGDRVLAVCIPPSIDLIVSLFAILQVKGVYLPLDVDFPTSRVNHILDDAKPQLLLVKGQQPAVAHLKTNFIDGVTVIDLNEAQLQIESEDGDVFDDAVTDIPPPCESLAAILYTSGSTGTPKGVRIPENAVLNRLVWQWRTFPYEQNEVCCFKTALTFVDSISEIFGPLLTGHQLIIIPKSIIKDVEKLVDVLEEFKIGRLVLVPSLLRSILLHTSRMKGSLPDLKLWICSGEIFPPDLLYSFFEAFKNNQSICNFYGSTEVMGDVTFLQFTSLDDVIYLLSNNKVPIGKPVSNVDIYLMDKEFKEVNDGRIGELLVAGLNTAVGYVGKAESDKFIENLHSSEIGYTVLYRTGDFARYVNGQLLYEGRTDSQLKVRGHRVDLSEIEASVQGVRGIDKCQVVCYRPGEIDQEILAFYTTNDNDITAEYMKIRIASVLPIYMHPKFVKIDEMPLLVNGKIDRQKLLKMYEDLGFRSALQETEFDLTNCEEGKEEMAKALIKILTRVLGPSAPKKISLDQNFFEIGGNSMNSVLAITSFHDAGYHIGITKFINAETLNDIVRLAIKLEDNPFDEDKVSKDMLLHQGKSTEYKCYPLKEDYKETVKSITAKSFADKGDLETLLKITENEMNNIVEQMWKPFLKQNLSFDAHWHPLRVDQPEEDANGHRNCCGNKLCLLDFIVCRDDVDDIVAVSLNLDMYAEPDIYYPTRNSKYVFKFLEECETKVRFCLPEGVGKIFHSIMMATKESISPGENVSLIRVMEEENINVAEKNRFEAVFTTNTSDLTQHVCDDLLSYKVLATYRVNKWLAEDGHQPFKEAQDSRTAVCSVYFITDEKAKS